MKSQSGVVRLAAMIAVVLMLAASTAFAVSYCHIHTTNGIKTDYFEAPRVAEDLLIEAIAPPNGSIWAWVDVGGQNIVAQVDISNGARQSALVDYQDLSVSNEFGSSSSGTASGTAYATLTQYDETHSCLPDDQQD